MCGILFHLSHFHPPNPSERLLELVASRGPDCLTTHTTVFSIEGEQERETQYYLSFTSSVLSLRGDHVTTQPLICPETASVLCWNGEAWKLDNVELLPHQNDGEELFRSLLLASASASPDYDIARVISSISGPFGFTYFDRLNGKIWFGRDCLGRRSLLLHRKEGELVISSVSDGDKEKGWEEIEADGVHIVNLRATLNDPRIETLRIPSLHQEAAREEAGAHMMYPYPALNKSIPSPPIPVLNSSTTYHHELGELLKEAIRLRVQNVPLSPTRPTQDLTGKVSKVGILFSGGLDCTVIARLVHEVLPIGESIDLLNVGFENKRVVQASMTGPNTRKKKSKPKSNGPTQKTEVDSINFTTSKTTLPPPPPPIDPYSLCPDRRTARQSLSELCETCPTRQWNFIPIDIPYTEFLAHRPRVISLIHPHNTEMDLSIAIAFYFAAKGEGQPEASDSSSYNPYTTPTRILLSGLGADELFAGYGRHATSFKKGGYQALLDELELDFMRLPKRNLGRDDRVISNWGKEARYPFLDEEVVAWAMKVGVEGKCQFEDGIKEAEGDASVVVDEPIEGGKKVLRLLAESLGLRRAAREKKRAVQFGARTAKMDIPSPGLGGNKREKVKGTKILDE